MEDPEERRTFRALLERSSLGSPGARKLRQAVSSRGVDESVYQDPDVLAEFEQLDHDLHPHPKGNHNAREHR